MVLEVISHTYQTENNIAGITYSRNINKSYMMILISISQTLGYCVVSWFSLATSGHRKTN